jgi:hypothetical protein
MKWIILITNMIFIQIHTQNVSLYILENSINLKDDTLYFRFRIQNNDKNSLVFYNLNLAENGCIIFTDSILQKRQPGLLVDMLNEKNELPSVIRARMGHIDFSKYDSAFNKYHFIRPNETLEYNIALDIWPSNLKKGEYKLQLKYYSNNFYHKNFIEAKKTDPKLKNSIMFKGILRSNIVSITVD